MTRIGPRDTGGSARTGWIRRASACEAVSPIASARRIEDNGTYVLSIDECVAGEKAPGHVCDDRTTHPERPPARASSSAVTREARKTARASVAF